MLADPRHSGSEVLQTIPPLFPQAQAAGSFATRPSVWLQPGTLEQRESEAVQNGFVAMPQTTSPHWHAAPSAFGVKPCECAQAIRVVLVTLPHRHLSVARHEPVLVRSTLTFKKAPSR